MIDHLFALYRFLLQSMSIPWNEESLRLTCEQYRRSDFNWLQLIGDFTEWNVAHVTVPLAALQRDDIFFPVVLKQRQRLHYVVVYGKTGEAFQLYDPWTDQRSRVDFAQLQDRFDSWAVLFEPTPIAGQGGNSWQQDLVRYLEAYWLVLVFVLALGYFLWSAPTYLATVLFLLAWCGFFLSHLIQRKQDGGAPLVVDRACENEKHQLSCRAVLDSPYAKLFGGISVADLGWGFFLYQIIYLLILQLGGGWPIALLFWYGNLAALVFMSVLLAIQHWRIRAYCVLCLCVFGVVLLLNGVAYFGPAVAVSGTEAWMVLSGILAAVVTIPYRRAHFFRWQSTARSVVLNTQINDEATFRALLRSTPAELPRGEAELALNFRPEARRVHLFISDTCQFCRPYLAEMLSLLLLSDRYTLIVQIKSENKDFRQKAAWLEARLAELVADVPAYFEVSVLVRGQEVFRGQAGQLPGQHLPGDPCAVGDRVTRFPSAYLEGRPIHQNYDGPRLKRQLCLLAYD